MLFKLRFVVYFWFIVSAAFVGFSSLSNDLWESDFHNHAVAEPVSPTVEISIIVDSILNNSEILNALNNDSREAAIKQLEKDIVRRHDAKLIVAFAGDPKHPDFKAFVHKFLPWMYPSKLTKNYITPELVKLLEEFVDYYANDQKRFESLDESRASFVINAWQTLQLYNMGQIAAN